MQPVSNIPVYSGNRFTGLEIHLSFLPLTKNKKFTETKN